MKFFDRPIGLRMRMLAAVLLLFSASVLLAERVEDLPKPTDYVSDFAHVLSPEAIARIDSLCAQLDHSAANAQVAVVTVKNLDGDDAADWASRLEDKWKMGKKGSDRGVLLLLAVDDHKYRIDVGYGLEPILPDGKVGDIGREMRIDLRQNDYNDAVMMAVGQIGQVIAQDAHVSLNDQGQPLEQPAQNVRRSSPFGGFILLIFLMMFFGGSWIFRLLFGWGLLSSIFGGRGGWTGGGGGAGSWGSGGGWGGGGGGGFGGFGGGSFGGGGAGGSW
jgi:uncharacterized protein